MLTLEEAVAKYKEAKDILIEYADTRRKHYPDGMGWATETLDAAVRDVARAVWYATVAPPSNSLSMAAVTSLPMLSVIP